jgi:hypothetical protein
LPFNRDVGFYDGILNWLPGGAWAAAEESRAHPSTFVDVPGLEAGDSATTYHRNRWTLTADLVIGGNWIEFTLQKYPLRSAAGQAAQADSARQIMTDIVANLRHS